MQRWLTCALFSLLAGCTSTPPPAVVADVPAATDELVVPAPAPEPTSTIYVRLEHVERSDDIEVETSIPILSSPNPELKRALAEITADLRDVVARNVSRVETLAAEEGAMRLGGQRYALHITCLPALLSDAVVSISCDAWEYMGGAHGLHGTTGHNYLITNAGAEPVELADLLERPDESVEAIAQLALSDLREQGATLVVDGIVPKLDARYLQNFTLTPDGLVFHFAPYIVGSYAEGDYEVTVSHAKLTPLLRRGEPSRALRRASAKPKRVKVILDFEASG